MTLQYIAYTPNGAATATRTVDGSDEHVLAKALRRAKKLANEHGHTRVAVADEAGALITATPAV